jgi:hypothetical protein
MLAAEASGRKGDAEHGGVHFIHFTLAPLGLCLKTSGLLLPSAGKRWLATTAARTQEVSGKAQGLQFVVHEAEYLKQEFLRGHGGSSLVSTE